MRYHFIKKSANSKTGPMPVTYTSRESCPPSCPHYRSSCYAEDYYTRLNWDKVNQRGAELEAFSKFIDALPHGTPWRMNVAGDLPGTGEDIDAHALGEIVRANIGKKGFTYTHKHTSADNLKWIKAANTWGFTVNLSADNAAEADTLADTSAGPVVCVVPMDTPSKTTTPAGRVIVVCPAQEREDVTCLSCQLCSHANRSTIVGFRAHGGKAKQADAKARKVIPIAAA